MASDVPRLDAYHFYEEEWDSYEELRAAFEWQVPDQFNVADYVCDRWAEKRKNGVALYATAPDGTERAYSFRQLRNAANQLATYLREQGVDRGDRVGVNGTQRVEPMVAHLAAFKLGAVSVPLSVLLGPDGLRFRLDDCDATAFVVAEGGHEALREVRDDLDALDVVLTAGDVEPVDGETAFWDALDGRSRQFETVATDAEDDCCIIYTSGTTGRPKGVVHAHRHLLGILPAFVRSVGMDVGRDQVCRTVVEWSWVGSLNDMVLPAWYYGVPVVAYARQEFEPEREFDLIETYGITRFAAPATAVRMMMQVEDPGERWDLSSVRGFGSGGESVGQSIVDWAHETFPDASVAEGYGQSEAGALIGDAPALGVEHRPGYMGVAGLGHEVAVLDPETHEVVEGPGEVGELAVRYEGNPMLFTEYLGRPGTTDEKIQDGWMLGEDLISMDEDGYIKFHSRTDDVIITSGYRVGPTEIEESLSTHPAVMTAGVIGVPHETRGEVPKAFVQLAPGHEPSDDLAAALQAHVKSRLAKYEYPRELAFVDELPRTTTGKVRRRDLREREGLLGGAES
ncbi:MAG: acyl-CoA synthetase [Haloarculaceae archaeon]